MFKYSAFLNKTTKRQNNKTTKEKKKKRKKEQKKKRKKEKKNERKAEGKRTEGKKGPRAKKGRKGKKEKEKEKKGPKERGPKEKKGPSAKKGRKGKKEKEKKDRRKKRTEGKRTEGKRGPKEKEDRRKEDRRKKSREKKKETRRKRRGKGMKRLVSVRGIPGSGKTYIAKKLGDTVRCIDTDDLVSEAYTDLARSRALFTVDDVLERAQRDLDVVCRELGPGVTVVVGVTLTVATADSVLFVSMSPRSLRAAYERTIRREVSKYAAINERAVRRLSADRIAPYLACKLHVNAFDPRREFAEYAEMYEKAFAFERSNGASPMTQREIISYVRRLSRLQRELRS